ncbi:hypothetical protein AVEN_84697-1 [Araneus ventricosus]|uniref:Uncharacterized protein n=1 Tax=Araneus ventricosus TaxID=182803 RepID=A0A4Y2IWN3_ARAVE|nr:hypothetical protein AVEN_84697-1 [Araneus ventricosus]
MSLRFLIVGYPFRNGCCIIRMPSDFWFSFSSGDKVPMIVFHQNSFYLQFPAVGNCYDIFGDTFNSIAKIVVKLDGLPTTTFTYSPKYQNIETFSYVGGYVGMWLGISLVAVFDFLETLVVILRYPFRRIMLHRARKQKVDQIRKFQRNV